MNKHYNNPLRFYYRWLLISLLAVCGISVAQAEGTTCNKIDLYHTFSAYLNAQENGKYLVTEQDVVTINKKLTAKGYGPVGNVKILGPKSRVAFEKFCIDQKVDVSRAELATTLVALLDKVPDADGSHESTHADAETPPPAPKPQPKAEAPKPPPTPVVVKQKVETPVVTKKTVTEPIPATLNGASSYYRWPAAPKEKKDETEKKEDSAEKELANMREDVLLEIGDDKAKEIAKIEGMEFPNGVMFESALIQLGLTGDDIESVKRVSLSEPPIPMDPLELKGSDCGCSRTFSNIVYGFYPYWLADKGIEQTLDYSYFDRIAYYAVSLNEEGNLKQPFQWDDNGNIGAFIKTAHKYYVGVDLTLYATGWRAWDEDNLSTAIHDTAAAIKKEFAVKGDDEKIRGDGVTLVFEGFGSSSKEQRATLKKYVREVSELLVTKGHEYQINLLLDADVNELTAEAFSDLENLLTSGEIQEEDGSENPLTQLMASITQTAEEAMGNEQTSAHVTKIEHVFIFQQHLTTNAKKELRSTIEKAFRGEVRAIVLRKVVPILSPYGDLVNYDNKKEKLARGESYKQFDDDLIYARENFGGAALWPVPLESVADKGIDLKNIKESLEREFAPKESGDYVGDMIEEMIPGLCKLVCPNRDLVRIVFDLLAGLLVLYGLIALWAFSLRRIFKENLKQFGMIILATLGIGFSLLVCDPFWQERANIVIVGIITTVIIIALARYIIRVTHQPYP